MLSQELKELIEQRPLCTWILGLFGAGKTTIRRQLERELCAVHIVCDGQFFFDVLKSDTDYLWHVGDEWEAVVTSTDYYVQMAQMLIQTIQGLRTMPLLIEKATGIGCNRAELSLMQLSAMIPAEIFSQSVFVYVYAPYEIREARNRIREERNSLLDGGHIPEDAFQRSQCGDDFQIWRQTLVRPLVIVNNY